MNSGYISARRLESESSKSFAVSISPQTKPHLGDSLQSPGHQNIPQVPGNRAEVCQNHDARKAVSATLLVLKWRGCIFWPRSSKVSVQKVMLCPFHCKARPSGSSLQSPELENILQVPPNRDEVGQNNDSRKAVSATLSVWKWSRAIFRSRSSKVSVQKVLLSQFHWKPRPSWVSLESPGVENIFLVLATQAEVGQNHDAPRAASATLSVLKWSGALFRPRSSKVSSAKKLLCLFHCKPRLSVVSLESPGVECISQVPENREDVGQNHDARKTVSATLSVLKWSGAIFRPRSSKVSVQKVLLCPFQCKPRPSGVT